MVSLECSAKKVVRFRLKGHENRVWHANEALANNDKAFFRTLTMNLPAEKVERGRENSRTRMRTVAAMLGELNVDVDVETLKQVFASRESSGFPVSLHYDPDAGVMGFTAGCAIYEHRQEGPPVLHLAVGPPDITPFGIFEFRGQRDS